jgi:hypothetical protein
MENNSDRNVGDQYDDDDDTDDHVVESNFI